MDIQEQLERARDFAYEASPWDLIKEAAKDTSEDGRSYNFEAHRRDVTDKRPERPC